MAQLTHYIKHNTDMACPVMNAISTRRNPELYASFLAALSMDDDALTVVLLIELEVAGEFVVEKPYNGGPPMNCSPLTGECQDDRLRSLVYLTILGALRRMSMQESN